MCIIYVKNRRIRHRAGGYGKQNSKHDQPQQKQPAALLHHQKKVMAQNTAPAISVSSFAVFVLLLEKAPSFSSLFFFENPRNFSVEETFDFIFIHLAFFEKIAFQRSAAGIGNDETIAVDHPDLVCDVLQLI